ncbi:MAG: pyridoxamine 5'-phosphate oxidase family protein [bacterium]|nr:pyridoxamine 5'-phosphate oxidase family protein [Gammaproteobacteria bacterium]HIL98491.1 pyridoxamine 5'-phosphate oxidase family protein [Pseudomonadales bacterium]
MAKLYAQLDDKLIKFIESQHMFFIGTAPLSGDGLVNLSPKGMDTLRILDEKTIAYLDLTGSGSETIAHLKQNGRFVLMFCSFTNKPMILRLHGKGVVLESDHSDYPALLKKFPERRGTRAIIKLSAERIADSCGWGVPEYEFVQERDTYTKYAANLSDEDFRKGQIANARSLDDLPSLATPSY